MTTTKVHKLALTAQATVRQLTASVAPTPVSYAFFSRRVYYVWWLGLLSLHVVGVVFFAAVAKGYWMLPDTYLDTCLAFYNLGLPGEHDHVLAYVHFAVACCHAAYLLWMLGWSVWRRSLVFGSGGWRISKWQGHGQSCQSSYLSSKSSSSSSSSNNAAKSRIDCAGCRQACVARLTPVLECLLQAYRAVFSRRGFFGVDNPNFDLLMAVREIVETSLQTVQAYRMSVFLPRTWLNRFFVILLVTNCWTTALMHHVYHDSPAHRRVLAILMDCLIDLTTSIVIPLILVFDYADDYDWSIHGFQPALWNNDGWFVNVLNEFQLILVVSWGDLASRLVFSCGMMSAMNSIKSLARPVSNQVMAKQQRDGPTANRVMRVGVLPPSKTTTETSDRSDAPELETTRPPELPPRPQRRVRSYSFLFAPQRLGERRQFFARVISSLFFVWGLVIVVLHGHAEMLPSLAQCKLQVRPWLVSSPACSLVELDCDRAVIAGDAADVAALWSAFDARTVVRVVVKHCPRLEVPPTLQRFSNLGGIKFYNSTIVRWEDDAAVMHAFHPLLTSVVFARVNFTNGALPQGLQSRDFPQQLADFEFCVTNLATLPDDLDTKWPKFATIYLERGIAMIAVPDVLVRLTPYYLSFAGTPIEELPAALFEVAGIDYLHVGGTHITTLPQHVQTQRSKSSLSYVVVQDTAVARFSPWIDALAASSAFVLRAANTPYCASLQRALESQQRQASALSTGSPMDIASSSEILAPPPQQLSMLDDFANANFAAVAAKVGCAHIQATVFPLAYEDTINSLLPYQTGGEQ